MYYLYILECRDGSYYTGITTDLKRRFKEHTEGTGAKYTRARGAVRIVYSEKLKNRSLASKREAVVKSLTRTQKTQLIGRKK